MKKILFLVLFVVKVFAIGIVSNDAYKSFENEKYNIIYSVEYEKEAIFIKENIDNFMRENDRSFKYKFDEQIQIILASNKTQVANAFSTQQPFNMNVHYNGGSSRNIYFANKSWLKTIFIHEMIHNYQVNAKKSKISKTLHTFFGNNYEPIWLTIPFFTIPNAFLPTLFLEGNAVYNESLYKNGGRLFNGSLNAMKNSLIFDDKITATRLINNHNSFPYTTEKYIVGGFYMEYLSQIYGHDKVNEFFYENSIHSINPFLLSWTFREVFNTSFEKSVKAFVVYSKDKYKGYKRLDAKVIASSKANIELSKIDDKIYFITSNLINKKQLYTYDIKSNNIQKKDSTLINGKVFKIKDTLFTNATSNINTQEIKYGLFDKNANILHSSIGKSMQDIYKNNTAYIDIKSSFSSSKLYINNSYYSDVSSNALFDTKENIYYFKQEEDERVLYKNKKRLFSFKGYFSKLIDIQNNEVYFIANTPNGSTLYKYSKDKIQRLHTSDDIINAKIISKNIALVVSISSNNYSVSKVTLEAKDSSVFYKKMKNERKNYVFEENTTNKNIQSIKYNELKELRYSYLYPSLYTDANSGNTLTLNANFSDPLTFNSVNLYSLKNDNKSILGLNYFNQRYTLPFALNYYNIKRDTRYSSQRDYGANIRAYLPLFQQSRQSIYLNFNKYFDDTNNKKNPNILNLTYNYSQNFSLETSPYLNLSMNTFIKEDRDDLTYGVNTKINKHLISQFYINAQALFYTSNTKSLINQRGIQIVSDALELTNDESNVFIYNINDGYVKSVNKLSLGFEKSFNFSQYFSRFPISLLNESLAYTRNTYNIQSNRKIKINEDIFALRLNLLLGHKLHIPLTIRYIRNDFLEESEQTNISTAFKF